MLGALLAFPAAGVAQRVRLESTAIVAPLAGQLATPAEGQSVARSFAPDLGLTDVHQGELRIVFGDVIQLRDGDPISLLRDDVQGHISLADFPDGDAVDAYVAAHPSSADRPDWQHQAPPVFFRLTSAGQASTIRVYDSASGALLNTGLFKAPVAAFSNALSGEAAGFFTIYSRSVPLQCSGGASPSCADGFECEARLGLLRRGLFDEGVACLLDAGTRGCSAVAGGGLCIDPTSSVYRAELPAGLLRAVVFTHAVGNADRDTPEHYRARTWHTNKFSNLAARTVNDFDPERSAGEGNDYRPTDGTRAQASKVLLWGRPGYIGTKADGRDLKLYFAITDDPSYSATGAIDWAPRYFTGLSAEGAPRFSSSQRDAVPLQLDGSPSADSETWDVVNQMSVSWVAALGSWVMLYGGGANPMLTDFFTSELSDLVQHDLEGAIHVRFAREPWGPWSAPQQLFAAGDPHPLDLEPPGSSQYAPGGILRHPMRAPRAHRRPERLRLSLRRQHHRRVDHADRRRRASVLERLDLAPLSSRAAQDRSRSRARHDAGRGPRRRGCADRQRRSRARRWRAWRSAGRRDRPARRRRSDERPAVATGAHEPAR